MFGIAWYDDVSAAERFKAHGAVIEDAAFLAAFGWKKFNVAEWFLRNGVNVKYADEIGNTALHLAIKRDYKTEYIELLLNHGANIHQENDQGMSARNLAERKNNKKILKLFERAVHSWL